MSLSSMTTGSVPSISSGPVRIPGFAESGFNDYSVGASPATATKILEPSYSRTNSLVDFHLDRRMGRVTLSPHDLRLNTNNGEPVDVNGMYLFQGNRSPMSSSGMHLSPQLGNGPGEPSSASSTTSSSNSLKNLRGRQKTKQPSSRPAAKRMRDTRDREGVAIQHMETDLEAEGRLADLKPLNANNKEEAGRRYPKADVLERYCELSNARKRSVHDESRKLRYEVRKSQVYERWTERWCSTFNKEARDQLEAMMVELGSPEPPISCDHPFEGTMSCSERSSFSDYDQRSATSAEWSPEESDFVGTRKVSQHLDAGFNPSYCNTRP